MSRIARGSRLFILAAALLAGSGASGLAGAEEGLGRLFFTPERRQILDHQRQMNIQEKQEVPVDPTLTVNGVVSRSSGKRTVWINGVSQNENDAQADIAVTPDARDAGSMTLRTAESPPARARVGDTVNRNTGEATGLLGNGQIIIRSSGRTSATSGSR